MLLRIVVLILGFSVTSTTHGFAENLNNLNNESIKPTTVQVSKDNNAKNKRFAESIKNIKGLVVLGEGYDKQNDLIRFYNADSSQWYQFTFYYDDSDGDFEYKNNDFRPYSFHPDYFKLAMKLIGETADYYEILVNEESGLKKYVKKSNKTLKFESWQDHILNTFAVEFDKTTNPLMNSPDGVPRSDDLSSVDRYAADKFEGDWLRVKLVKKNNPQNDTVSTDSAWIRWRKDDLLLIEWVYFA